MELLKADDGNVDNILAMFDMETTQSGKIVHKESGDPVKGEYTGEPLYEDNFAILPGSKIFLKNSAYSLASYRAEKMLSGG